MKKTFFKFLLYGAILGTLVALMVTSIERGNELSEKKPITLYVTNKVQSPYYYKYSMSTQNWLVFMDTDGVYREIEVSVGTYLTVNPPRNVTFYLSKEDLNLVRNAHGFLKFSGGYYVLAILYIFCILILGCIFWARGDYKFGDKR